MNPFVIGCIVFSLLFAACCVVVLIRMDPSERRDWLQRAAQVALVAEGLSMDAIKGLTPEQEAALCTRVNTYLKLHGIHLTVKPAELQILLAEIRLLIPTVAKL